MRATLGTTGVLVAVLLIPLLLITALLGGLGTTPSSGAVNVAALPPLARDSLATISTITAATCPDLPPVWIIAEIQAESGWNPAAFSHDRNGGAAGLYQLNQTNWITAGGRPWTSSPPPADADILQPDAHLQHAIPWVCTNLHTATAHLQATGKPAAPLDAMLVCHIAGCGRVTGSATGIPVAGEAGCDRSCADLVATYIDRVHRYVSAYSDIAGPVPINDLPTPAPFAGPSTGCTDPDPTGGRCLSPATHHAYDQVVRAFGTFAPDAPIHAAGCWDAHAWNPNSDHSRGRACDFFPTTAGQFPQGQELLNGWRLATWLRAHASELHVTYLIWQGRFWSPTTPDTNGWGIPYTGGGIYDTDTATGGHYDHVHLSVSS